MVEYSSKDLDLFAIVFFTLLAATAIALISYSTLQDSNNKIKDAVDFCGCNDKSCILLYMRDDFKVSDYNRECL